MKLAIEVGQQLRKLRKSQGLTMSQLAKICGMHAPNISDIENGKHNSSIGTLSRVAECMGHSLKIKIIKGVKKVELHESN